MSTCICLVREIRGCSLAWFLLSVGLLHYGMEDSLNFLELLSVGFSIRLLILINPFNGLFCKGAKLWFFVWREDILEFLITKCILDMIAHWLKTVLGLNLFSDFLILISSLGCFLYKLLYLSLWKSSLLVCDGDLVLNLWSLVLSVDIHDSVLIDIKWNLDLRNSSGSWSYSIQVKLT